MASRRRTGSRTRNLQPKREFGVSLGDIGDIEFGFRPIASAAGCRTADRLGHLLDSDLASFGHTWRHPGRIGPGRDHLVALRYRLAGISLGIGCHLDLPDLPGAATGYWRLLVARVAENYGTDQRRGRRRLGFMAAVSRQQQFSQVVVVKQVCRRRLALP